MRGRKAGIAVGALLAALAAFAIWLGYIGYFGGPVFFELPAEKPSPPELRGTVAVILSGDMGFRIGMGPRIAKRLAADGIPVLGVSSLTYFRHERSPVEAAALLDAAAGRALAFGHADRLILIGQSFGADMLHVGLVDMPPALRAKVAMVGLVVPTDSLIFRASPSELFNWTPPDAPALPTARALDWVPAVCIQGREEEDSLCPHLDQPNMRRLVLPGGHPLHRDVDALHAALWREILATARAPRAGAAS
ncbi:AcvB/VirJ family lysyl-phosphatidylglycerol hydrolase [Edaphosphingomonas haloaromaticamans]|uniref:Bacterial virulence protein (VirJ) n=1 Tax=Edaphosphingomonas haloaromaticamans TaxID=653954 RepID=A0A1S1HDM4_9SPHN|nr:AcvB/VirJ family lysyl-phosphatidylglycerol hydrolase [Sphingomonas haloaromaticamans]OHT20339.1 Bacterial virulence protein (VirJ) [Sphingomonas haloaromaticamans]